MLPASTNGRCVRTSFNPLRKVVSLSRKSSEGFIVALNCSSVIPANDLSGRTVVHASMTFCSFLATYLALCVVVMLIHLLPVLVNSPETFWRNSQNPQPTTTNSRTERRQIMLVQHIAKPKPTTFSGMLRL